MYGEPISDRAQGRWYDILRSLGVSAGILSKKHGPCPFCGGKDRFRWTDYDGHGGFFCNQCGSGNGFEFIKRLRVCEYPGAVRLVEELVGEARYMPPKPVDPEVYKREIVNLYRASQVIKEGDPAKLYLERRVPGIEHVPKVLRFVKECQNFEVDKLLPAMIAEVADPGGKGVNLMRVYLTWTGEKADVEGVRKLMRGSVPPGSAIRLYPAKEILGVAEGLETALAAAHLFRVRTWALINTTNMEAWRPPDTVREVIIFGDNDAKFGGQKAAYNLAHKIAVKGDAEVNVRIPDQVGEDWNDVYLAQRRTIGA